MRYLRRCMLTLEREKQQSQQTMALKVLSNPLPQASDNHPKPLVAVGR